jgi:hypothetical protein
MLFPAQSLTILDPGPGTSPAPAASIPVMSGVCAGGTGVANTLYSIGSIPQVRTILGYGPLAEDVAYALQEFGGPVLAVIHNTSGSNLSAAATTQVGSVSPPAVTVSGTPRDEYKLQVSIVAGGARGTATFQFTLDAWDATIAPFTMSDVRTIPSGGTYAIPNTGLTLNFAAGTYVAADTYSLACVPQIPGTVDLAAVKDLLVAAPSQLFYLWHVAGTQASATTAAALAAAFSGHLTTLTSSFRYAAGFMDVGSGDTASNVKTQADSWTSLRVSPAYGYVYMTSCLPFEGFSTRKVSCVAVEGIRAMKEQISSDLSRTAAGPAANVLGIVFDAFTDQTVDAKGITTMRTWPGIPGFYISSARIKCPFGSNFTDLAISPCDGRGLLHHVSGSVSVSVGAVPRQAGRHGRSP